MRNFLVCDGGGTKTDFLIFNEKAEVLSYCKKTGTNALFINEEKAINNVIEGINECIGKSKLSINDLEYLSITGSSRKNKIRNSRGTWIKG